MQEVKTALITGGSSGLGLAMAKQLSREGYITFIVARNSERLSRAEAEIKEIGNPVFAFQGDVTKPDEMTAIAEQIRENFGVIDLLILNAGVVHTNLLTDFERISDVKDDIEIDLWGTVLTAKVFIPLLQKGGRILMISSGFGLMGAAGYGPYCAAKAGIINFGESLRRELLSKKIAVYVACPSDIDTPQFREEQASMPDWMNVSAARGNVMKPETAAAKILKKCRGKRFLIIINPELYFLIFLQKAFPRKISAMILDRIFPRPEA